MLQWKPVIPNLLWQIENIPDNQTYISCSPIISGAAIKSSIQIDKLNYTKRTCQLVLLSLQEQLDQGHVELLFGKNFNWDMAFKELDKEQNGTVRVLNLDV